MSNRIAIRHGTGAPTTQHLLPNELGYSTSNNVLYIRRVFGDIDEVVPLTTNEIPSSFVVVNKNITVTSDTTEIIIDSPELENNLAVFVNLDYTAQGLTKLNIEDFRAMDLIDGGEVKDGDDNVINTSIKLKVNGKVGVTEETIFPLVLLIAK